MNGRLERDETGSKNRGPSRAFGDTCVVSSDQELSRTAEIMAALKESLRKEFQITHTTIHFECGYCGQVTEPCTQP
jgi:hypothetical protein